MAYIEKCTETARFVRFSTLPFADEFRSLDLSLTFGDAQHTLFTRNQILREIERHYGGDDDCWLIELKRAVKAIEPNMLVDLSS